MLSVSDASLICHALPPVAAIGNRGNADAIVKADDFKTALFDKNNSKRIVHCITTLS